MTAQLSSKDRLSPHGDAFYEHLIQAHEGLSFDQSAAFNARLILLLANEIGDIDTLTTAIQNASNNEG